MWYYPLIFWTLRGMEVGLLTALLLCGVKQAINLETNCHSRSLKRLAIVMGLCLLTRTDALIPCSLLMFFAIVRVPETYRLQVAIWCGAGLVGTLALHTFFRFAYYGDWLPNTYYLKMTGVSLGERLSRGWFCFQSTGFKHLYAPVGMSFFAIIPAFRPIRSFLVLLAILFTAQCGYSVYVGGDAWELPDFTNRYLCIAMPLLFLLTGVGIQGFWEIISKWIPPRFAPIHATVCGVLLVLTLNLANFQNWQKNGGFQVKNDGLAAQIGLTLRNCTQPEASIGVVWAGATPYFAHRRAIDLLGKSDRVIAHGLPKGRFLPGHNKWDYSYSIGQLHPDVIVRLWNATDADFRYLQLLGYRYLENHLWVNPASPYLNPCIHQSFTL
ncbi:MAG: hypothetical protein K1Y36_25600 [Blastocatellia bacterium]|nr:hypothetical protein [Blastocatellia bacterium]